MKIEDFLALYDREVTDRSWVKDALCKGMGTETFFPGQHQRKSVIEACKFCSACPVQDRCLDYGLEEEHGIWGGTSGRQRQKSRRNR
jgi:WhiB family redox-sensing transcriptional regulator